MENIKNYREFWLYNEGKGVDAIDYISLKPDVSIENEFTHVIEYSSYLAAQKECERADAKISRLEAALQKCKEQRDWYAKEWPEARRCINCKNLGSLGKGPYCDEILYCFNLETTRPESFSCNAFMPTGSSSTDKRGSVK